jgi:hypothetical protein
MIGVIFYLPQCNVRVLLTNYRLTPNTGLVISSTFGFYYLDKNVALVIDQDAGCLILD